MSLLDDICEFDDAIDNVWSFGAVILLAGNWLKWVIVLVVKLVRAVENFGWN